MSDIKKYQNSVGTLIPKASMCRVLRELLQRRGNFRITPEAIDALHESAEAYLVGLFDDAYKLTLHRQRVTLNNADIHLTLYIRGQRDPGVK